MLQSIPWVEKYRPSNFEAIVLDKQTHRIMSNILSMNYFPHLLLYGPPGTGKTTTIINIVNEFQKNNYGQINKDNVLHLNASDDRGIDVIRTQINMFVNSKTFFSEGLKFVILDEIDYMTKSAQQALRYVIGNTNTNIRFCIMCNYICKIDEALQNEFIKFRFTSLPVQDIISFLRNISIKENLEFSDELLQNIQQTYVFDIRSMVNFMQSNASNINIITDCKIQALLEKIKTTSPSKLTNELNIMSVTHNMDVKNISVIILSYIVKQYPENNTRDFLNFAEKIIHYNGECDCYFLHYLSSGLSEFIK